MKSELEQLPRMKRCVLDTLQDVYGPCDGRIEWEHVWTYAGRQINELWAIIGACHGHHLKKEGVPSIKDAFQTASLEIAILDELAKYPKAPWGQIIKSLGLV